MIVPVTVTGSAQLTAPRGHPADNYKFTLFAVWANNPADPDRVYVEQVWKAIHHYSLSGKNTILQVTSTATPSGIVNTALATMHR